MAIMELCREGCASVRWHWFKGFEAHTKHWPQTHRLLRAATTKDFVALLGYELKQRG